jgi:hypothetical protein
LLQILVIKTSLINDSVASRKTAMEEHVASRGQPKAVVSEGQPITKKVAIANWGQLIAEGIASKGQPVTGIVRGQPRAERVVSQWQRALTVTADDREC